MKQKIEQILAIYDAEDQKIIQRALKIAQEGHKNQKRFSGEPYIIHPILVAHYLAGLNLNAETVAAGLLHDVVEDTKITLEDLSEHFSVTIINLVDGCSKLGSIRLKREDIKQIKSSSDPHSPYSFERQLQILRKMFLATASDLRVVLIKLSDRLHNMQTLQYVPKEKQYRIARETLEIYAPLAHRLGMGDLKGELEDLAFPYVYPEDYIKIQSGLKKEIPRQKLYIEKIKQEISNALNLFSIEHQIDGRVKHFYSLYKKMQKTNKNINEIYDLIACRVIVNTIEDCYSAMGLIHQIWKPLKGTIKDYIAVPKPNGYQSIHTTVFGIDGKITEIQIRTKSMHEQAEHGIAAHWHYTDQFNPEDKLKQQIYASKEEANWVKYLSDLNEKLISQQVSPDDVKIDFFQDRIFVFTPRGDVHELPLGSTPVDFAYSVHTDIGNHCYGAKVDNKMVSLGTQLSNGDIVEIITNRKAHPKEDWLKLVKTAHAKTVIKHYLKSEDS